MKLLFDFLPVLLFFAAYKLADIYVATGVAIAAAIVQIVWSLARREKVKPIQWISLGFISLFFAFLRIFCFTSLLFDSALCSLTTSGKKKYKNQKNAYGIEFYK